MILSMLYDNGLAKFTPYLYAVINGSNPPQLNIYGIFFESQKQTNCVFFILLL